MTSGPVAVPCLTSSSRNTLAKPNVRRARWTSGRPLNMPCASTSVGSTPGSGAYGHALMYSYALVMGLHDFRVRSVPGHDRTGPGQNLESTRHGRPGVGERPRRPPSSWVRAPAGQVWPFNALNSHSPGGGGSEPCLTPLPQFAQPRPLPRARAFCHPPWGGSPVGRRVIS